MRKILAFILAVVGALIIVTPKASAVDITSEYLVETEPIFTYVTNRVDMDTQVVRDSAQIVLYVTTDSSGYDDYIEEAIETNTSFGNPTRVQFIDVANTPLGDSLINGRSNDRYDAELFTIGIRRSNGNYRIYGPFTIDYSNRDVNFPFYNAYSDFSFIYRPIIDNYSDTSTLTITYKPRVLVDNKYLSWDYGHNLPGTHFKIQQLYVPHTVEEYNELETAVDVKDAVISNLRRELDNLHSILDEATEEWQENVFLGQTFYGLLSGVAEVLDVILELGFLGFKLGDLVALGFFALIVKWLLSLFIGSGG